MKHVILHLPSNKLCHVAHWQLRIYEQCHFIGAIELSSTAIQMSYVYFSRYVIEIVRFDFQRRYIQFSQRYTDMEAIWAFCKLFDIRYGNELLYLSTPRKVGK